MIRRYETRLRVLHELLEIHGLPKSERAETSEGRRPYRGGATIAYLCFNSENRNELYQLEVFFVKGETEGADC